MDKRTTYKINKAVKEKVLRFGKILEEQGIPVAKLVIFGSYAKKQFDKHSDIDVCIVSSAFGKDIIGDLKFLLAERRKIDNRIEPHPFSQKGYNELENPLVWEIRKYGLEIKTS